MMGESLALYYLKEENVFMDGEGEIVFEIFEIITPNDLYLFKRHKAYMIASHRTEPGIFVELYWPEDEEERYFDVGDDYERIERYEKARLSGCFI